MNPSDQEEKDGPDPEKPWQRKKPEPPRSRPSFREPEPPPDMGDDAGMRMLFPVGRSGWAIASGYLGLISVLCLPSPLALITGILAIREMNRNPKKHGMGRAIFGIVMGTIGTICLLFVLYAMAVGK